MAVDTSNLVNMLATQPGQNMANLGATLLGAQQVVQQREAATAKNAIEQRKLALEERIANQELSLKQVELQGKVFPALAQTMLTLQDPLAKQQYLTSQIPTLKQAGVSDEQIKMGLENVNNNKMWEGIQVSGAAATEFWKEKQPKETKETMDDFTRAVDLRQDIIRKLKDSPKDSQLQTDLRDVNARIARLSTITGRTPQDISATQRVKMGAELDSIQQGIGLLQGLSEEYSKNPGAAGVVGSLKETLGSIAEQFLGGTGEQISSYLGTEKARQIRTDTRLALGRLLPVITGDTSGRYTDAEKNFAQETLGGLDKLTSDQAVVTSINRIVKILEDSEQRMGVRLGKEVPQEQQSSPKRLKYNPESGLLE